MIKSNYLRKGKESHLPHQQSKRAITLLVSQVVSPWPYRHRTS